MDDDDPLIPSRLILIDRKDSLVEEWQRMFADCPEVEVLAGDYFQRPADAIVINAYMSAYTAGLLAWADCNGEHKLEELIQEAFDALQDG